MRTRLWLVPLVVALAACSDMLEESPTSVLTNETFYTNTDDMQKARLALYASLLSGYGFGWAAYPSLASDEAKHHVGEPTALIVEPDYLDYTPGSGNIPPLWSAWFPMVFRANLILDNVADADLTEEFRALVTAEASFFRAYAYMNLVKSFGDVPLLLSAEDHANPDMTRTDALAVLDQVLADLQVAENGLPLTQTLADNGLLRQGAAQMALAETYLLRSGVYGTGEWQAAADAARQVIDSGVYSLNADFFSTFFPENKGNPELIFVVTGAGQNGPGTAVGLLYGVRELPFFFPGGGFQILVPTDWLLNLYPAGDYRREGYANHPITGEFPVTQEVAVLKFPWHDPAYATEAEFSVYRYAEALLMVAEAENELGNPAQAITYLNMVRARARGGATGAEARPEPADLPVMSQAETREAIYTERALELAFEGKRWFDMIRRNGLEPGYWGTSLEDHDPYATGRHPIQEYRMLFPIPASEIASLPGITQNPGY